jgi:hypothetical protein
LLSAQISGNPILDISRAHRPGIPSRMRGARTANIESIEGPAASRNLLWAPSNLISSVFDVFRKVQSQIKAEIHHVFFSIRVFNLKVPIKD